MIEHHEDLDTEQIFMVNFNQFGPSSLDFFIYTYTKTVDWRTFHNVKQDVLFKAMQIIEKHGAEVAFPTHTLHMSEDNKVHILNEKVMIATDNQTVTPVNPT